MAQLVKMHSLPPPRPHSRLWSGVASTKQRLREFKGLLWVLRPGLCDMGSQESLSFRSLSGILLHTEVGKSSAAPLEILFPLPHDISGLYCNFPHDCPDTDSCVYENPPDTGLEPPWHKRLLLGLRSVLLRGAAGRGWCGRPAPLPGAWWLSRVQLFATP